MIDLATLGIEVRSDGVLLATERLRALEAEGRKVEGTTQRTTRATESMDRTMQGLRRTLAMVGPLLATLGLGVSFQRSFSMIADFERSMAGVRAITRATAQEFEQMSRVARQLGATTIFSSSQAAEGMKFLGMAGFDTSQIIKAMPATLDLAAAATLSMGEAADITSNIMSAFGVRAEETGRIADALAAAAAGANTDVRQMGDAMKYVGPVASALGISMEDAAAAVGALSNAGIQGTMAGTGLRRILSSLANATPAATRALADMGLSLEELNPRTNSIIEIVKRLAAANLDATAAFEIFGDRGAPAILALISQIPGLERLTETVNNSAGEAKRMADIMNDTLRGDLMELESVIEELILQMGDRGLVGSMRNVVQTVTGVLQVFAGMADEADENTKRYRELAHAVEMTARAVAAFVAAKLVLAMAAQFTAAARAVQAFTIAMARNPLGLALVLLTQAVSALIMFRDQIRPVSDSVATLGDYMRAAWVVIADGARAVGAVLRDDVAPKFELLFRLIEPLLPHIKQLMAGLANSIIQSVNIIIGVFRALIELPSLVARAIVQDIPAAFKAVGDAARAIWADLKAAASGDFSGSNFRAFLQNDLPRAFQGSADAAKRLAEIMSEDVVREGTASAQKFVVAWQKAAEEIGNSRHAAAEKARFDKMAAEIIATPIDNFYIDGPGGVPNPFTEEFVGRVRDSKSALDEYTDGLRTEIQLMQMSARDRAIQEAVLRAEAIARREQVQLLPQQVALIKRLAAEQYDLAQAQSMVIDQTEVMQEAWRQAARNMQDTFADTFRQIFDRGISSFSDLGKRIVDIFKGAAAQILGAMAFRELGFDTLFADLMSGATGLPRRGGQDPLTGALQEINVTARKMTSVLEGTFMERDGGIGGPPPGERPLAYQLGDFFGDIGRGMRDVLGPLGEELKGAIKGIGDFMSRNLGFGGMGGIGTMIGQGLGGAGVGSLVGGASDLLGLGLSNSGAQIGGAAGAIAGSIIPGLGTVVGGLIGSALGGIIGGLFGGKTAKAFDVIGTGPTGELRRLGETYTRGKGDASVASGMGTAVMDMLRNIAGALDRDLAAGFEIGRIGHRKDKFVFEVPNTTASKEFGATAYSQTFDTAEEAVAAALKSALERGVIQGLSEASKQILATATDFNEAIRKVQQIESMPQTIEDSILAIVDPLQHALNQLEKVQAERAEIAKLAGVDMARIEYLNGLERQKIIEQFAERGTNSIQKMLDEMERGSSSPLGATTVLANAQAEFERIRELALAGDATAQGKIAGVAQDLLDAARDVHASSQSYFDIFYMVRDTLRAVQDVAGTVTPITSIGAGTGPTGAPVAGPANDNLTPVLKELGISQVKGSQDIVDAIRELKETVAETSKAQKKTQDELQRLLSLFAGGGMLNRRIA